MTEELKDKLVKIGRWIAVVPGGILCGNDNIEGEKPSG